MDTYCGKRNKAWEDLVPEETPPDRSKDTAPWMSKHHVDWRPALVAILAILVFVTAVLALQHWRRKSQPQPSTVQSSVRQ